MRGEDGDEDEEPRRGDVEERVRVRPLEGGDGEDERGAEGDAGACAEVAGEQEQHHRGGGGEDGVDEGGDEVRRGGVTGTDRVGEQGEGDEEQRHPQPVRREVLAVDAGDRAGTADDRPLQMPARLFGDQPVPDGFDLMSELIRRVRTSEVGLEPTGQSGWYDHQTWSLETLVVPEQDEQAEEPGGAPHAARV